MLVSAVAAGGIFYVISEFSHRQFYTWRQWGQRAQILHGKGIKGEKKNHKQGRIEPERAGSCEEVQFVLVKLAAIWPASELVLEVIFIAAFTAWQARTAPVRECLPASTWPFS